MSVHSIAVGSVGIPEREEEEPWLSLWTLQFADVTEKYVAIRRVWWKF